MTTYNEEQLRKAVCMRTLYHFEKRPEVPEHLSTHYLAAKFNKSEEEIEQLIREQIEAAQRSVGME